MSKLGLMLYATCRREALLTAAAEAEERGFDSVFMNEGFGRDAISSLATIAAHTRSIRVGSAIITTPTRSAALLATTAASMTDLTGGRFILGLGTGHPERIRDQHAMQYAKPTDRLNDYVNIIRSAAAGEEVNYEGKVVSVKGLKLQFSLPGVRIPIYFAALGPRTSRLAGALADGVILHLVTPSYIEDVCGWIAEGARAAGRSPDEIEVVCIAMTSLDAELIGRARRHVPAHRVLRRAQDLSPGVAARRVRRGGGPHGDGLRAWRCRGRRRRGVGSDARLAAGGRKPRRAATQARHTARCRRDAAAAVPGHCRRGRSTGRAARRPLGQRAGLTSGSRAAACAGALEMVSCVDMG